ncbi:MAG: type IV secretory system conjugative DNA transfer family protein, partial [Clostridia bacterium]|nr:type IV secretory system conjugative DNA transfer family protein [Clostridia bacterium]
MEKKRYDYEYRWNRYAFPETGARFASRADLLQEFAVTPLNAYASAAGIPLCFTDEPRKARRGKTAGQGLHRAVVNDRTENTLIYGETGSMKTRAVIRPLLFSLICRGESMVVTDPKGELSTDPKVRGLLDEMGYETAFLDFRNFAGDGYNLFEYAYNLYRRGERDKAV